MKRKKSKLMVIVGYSGAGKTTLSKELGKKYDLIVLSEDDYVFGMNPASMVKRVARKKDRVLGMENLELVLRNVLGKKRSVVVEGALIDGPMFLRDFEKVAEECGCEFIPVMITAKRNVRVRRKDKKGGHVISAKLDNRLRTGAKSLGYADDCVRIDTSKMTLEESLAVLEELWLDNRRKK